MEGKTVKDAPERTPAHPRLALALAAFALVLAAPPGLSQKLRDKSKPVNDPVQCPYCHGDPELMAAAGIVSHGGFEFAKEDTKAIDEYMATDDIRWIETPHFEIGFALRSLKVTQKEKAKIRAELGRLVEVLPDVKPKARVLDPWLRAHLYAQRVEDLWDQFLTIVRVEESEFPKGDKPWDLTGKYMGQGPYLGQKGKFEILFLPSEGSLREFLRKQFGLMTRLSQRWNVIARDSLILVVHTQQGSLRVDAAMHGHIAFNLAEQFLNGYKHYSYDTPVWIHEGLAHWIERSIDPNYNSFDSSEGAVAEMTSKSKWRTPTLKLVRSGKALRMAQLMALRGFAELKLEHHFTTWSMMDFLMTEHPEFLAKLLDGINGLTNRKGYDDGSGLNEVHRKLFKTELGMSYAKFDEAWRTWVLANYGSSE